jgi:tetratricopeptide (TPR) repeat protein
VKSVCSSIRFVLYAGCVGGSLFFARPCCALDAAEQLQFADGLYARGMWDTALKEYQAFLVQNPDKKTGSEAVYYRMGESFRALGRIPEADAAYQRAYDDYPNGEFHYRAGLRRAEFLEQAGQGTEQVQLLVAMLRSEEHRLNSSH